MEPPPTPLSSVTRSGITETWRCLSGWRALPARRRCRGPDCDRGVGILPRSKALELLPAQFRGYRFLLCALYLIFRLQYRPALFGARLGVRFGQAHAFRRGRHGLGPCAWPSACCGALLQTPDIDSPLSSFSPIRTSIVVMAVFAVTLGPLCEELFFRGFMQPLLVRSLGVVAGIVLTALPFGLLHGCSSMPGHGGTCC